MIYLPCYISKKQNVAPINIGVGVDPFNRNDELCSQVWYEGIVSVEWMSNGDKVNYPSDRRIFAYPTPDMEKMVIVKLDEKAGNQNSIILNEKGQEIFSPNLPVRISKEKWLPKGELYRFLQCGWCDIQDCIFFFLSIADTDWMETRYFNYKTMTWDQERYETWRL